MCNLLFVSTMKVLFPRVLTFVFSIISVMDGSLPKKPCKTCKNRFHAGCLYKVCNLSSSRVALAHQ